MLYIKSNLNKAPSVYRSGCISVGAHSQAVLTSQAKTKALSLIFTGFSDHSFSIDYGEVKVADH